MNKGVILCSAGVDSYILRAYLTHHKHNFDNLYFDHGGRYVNKELHYLPDDVIVTKSLNLKDLEEESAFIPNRNILMATIAASMGYDKIWIGGSASDRVNDNNKKVFDDLSEYLTGVNGRYIKIDSPFWNVYKEDMIRWFYNNKVGCVSDLVDYTFSCFNPIKKKKTREYKVGAVYYSYKTYECHGCSACFRKSAALHSIGIMIPFYNSIIASKYQSEFTNCIEDTPRTIGTLDYVKFLRNRKYVN